MRNEIEFIVSKLRGYINEKTAKMILKEMLN